MKKLLWIGLAFGAIHSAAFAQTILFVKPAGPSDTCTSWAAACPDLQDAPSWTDSSASSRTAPSNRSTSIPCGGDGQIDIFDIFRVLDAFAG